MDTLRSHPNSERLVNVVYNVLAIISSQGVLAFCSVSALKSQGQNRGLGRWAGEGPMPKMDSHAVLCSEWQPWALLGNSGQWPRIEWLASWSSQG